MLVASTSEISHIGVALPFFIFPNMILSFHQIMQKVHISTHIPFTQSNLNKVVFMKSYQLYAILMSHFEEQYKSIYFASFLGAVCGILT